MQDIPAVDFERDAVKRPDHGNVQSWGKVVNICCALVLEDLFSATEARSRRLNNKHYIDSKANIHITTKFDRPQEPNHKAGSASWCNPCIKFNMLKEHGNATERKKGKKEVFLHFHILWGIRATAKKKKRRIKDTILTEQGSVLGIGGATDQLEDVGTSRVDEGDDSTSQGRPVDPGILLVGEDSQEAKGNDEGTSNITLLLLVFDVADSSSDQEDDSGNDKDTTPDPGTILINGGEDLEQVDDGREDNPSVPQGEGSMDEELIVPGVGGIVLLQVV